MILWGPRLCFHLLIGFSLFILILGFFWETTLSVKHLIVFANASLTPVERWFCYPHDFQLMFSVLFISLSLLVKKGSNLQAEAPL